VNHLLRAHAPISESSWSVLDEEAQARLRPALAARRLVDFKGPFGWDHAATNLGRSTLTDGVPGDAVSARERSVLPVLEVRAAFALARAELEDADRGAPDPDLEPLDDAALRIATAENAIVLTGSANRAGIAARTPHEAVSLGGADNYPAALAQATGSLLAAGVGGPYGLALGGEQYRVAVASHDGYPLLEHLQRITEGPIVWAPGIDGGVLVSLRRGDFVFECGQDLSIGYSSHDDRTLNLYLEESFSFYVATPEAAVVLEP
jgi:uncharacterized linocin/CFP29 family protein